MPDQDPVPAQRNRVRVFVDFWNYTLSMREVDSQFRTDWSALGPVLARAAGPAINPPIKIINFVALLAVPLL